LIESIFVDFEIIFLDYSDLGLPESVWEITPKNTATIALFELRKSINFNINISETQYVARSEVQTNYVEYHPEVSSLSSGIKFEDDDQNSNVLSVM